MTMPDNSTLLNHACVTTMGDQEQSSSSYVDDENSKGEIHKRMTTEIETEEIGHVDWISQIPDALIVQILSLLSITDACRTSILSKRWQYLWTCIDTLVYDYTDYSRSDSSTVHKFISLTDRVLPLLSCSRIKRFALNFAFHYDDGVSYNAQIDKWLELAVNKKVEDLYLNIFYGARTYGHGQPYSLPQVLCSSSSIVKLKCIKCRISEDYVLNWTSLKSLTLKGLFLRDEHLEQIMSNCPQLESLTLQDFCGFNRLHMTSPKCKQLQLGNHDHPVGYWGSFENDCFFEIVAPYVQHLVIDGDFNYTEIRLGNLASVAHAYLTLYCDEYDAIGEKMMKDLLVSVRCANELAVSSWFLEVIFDLISKEEDVSLPLLECRSLTIISCITKYSFPGLDYLLRSTPYLEKLIIFPDIPRDRDYQDVVNLPGAHDYLSLQESIFKVSLQNLKNVKVVLPYCTCICGPDAIELDQFLKFLLEHAINLEKLVIASENNNCRFCSPFIINIEKLRETLLGFVRTSNNPLIYLMC